MNTSYLYFLKLIESLPKKRREIYNELYSLVNTPTPLKQLTSLSKHNNNIFIKFESENVMNVHHIRLYPFIFASAESNGYIAPHMTPVIEATNGGAGVAFAFCAKYLGFNRPCAPQVVVPFNFSAGREKTLKKLGAVIHKVPPGVADITICTSGAVAVANQLINKEIENKNMLHCI